MKIFLYLFLAAAIFAACQSCKKDPTLPSVTTTQISAITINSVTSGGMITNDGNAKIIACGVCYGLNSKPEITDDKTRDYITNNGFTSQVTKLEPGKTYYLRAYATNEVGTSYGEIISFNTSGVAPAATTLDASDIVFDCATLNGTINTDGIQTTITFIYGMEENNLNQSVGITPLAKGTPSYKVNASVYNLAENTTYYFALKAVNSLGTVVGETKSFKTLDGHLTDIDGNVYKLVKIGNQIWMAENLKVTHYNDGTGIPNVTDTQEWGGLTSGAYCDYDNDPSNSLTYGRLYNAYSIWSEKLAPAGWHVPSDAEWTQLFDFVNRDGGSLKETGLTHWVSPNTGATNSSDFNALPNGGRPHYLGQTTFKFDHLGYAAMWWASDKLDDYTPSAAYLMFLVESNANIYDDWIQSGPNGFGIRLIKDE